jgi:hypothetical protein
MTQAPPSPAQIRDELHAKVVAELLGPAGLLRGAVIAPSVRHVI